MFNKLSLFIEIANCGSISQAAENLFLSQSTASTQLQSLEKELQVKLFDRVNRNIILNENGKVFLEFAQRAMTSYLKTMQIINEDQHLSRFTLSFCAGIYFNIYFLPNILSKFTKQFGNINIQIATPPTDEIISNIQNKKCDFGIINTSKDLDNSGFVIDFVYEHPLFFICSPNNPLSKEKTISKKELNNQTFIFNKKTSHYRNYVSTYLVNMDIEPKMKITIETMEATKKAVINNLGVSILPSYMVKKELEHNELVQIIVKDSVPITRSICCIHNIKRKPSQISIEFIRICREYFQKLENSSNES
jgi:DNA-binding transcriptional LysR family regulator